MAKTNFADVLPYTFQNTGNKTGTIINILSAPAIELDNIAVCGSKATVKGYCKYYRDESVLSIDNMLYSTVQEQETIFADLLNGADRLKRMKLWQIKFWSNRFEMRFRDVKQRESDDHEAGAMLAVENFTCATLRANIDASNFGPARELLCQYGDDVQWGRWVMFAEKSEGRVYRFGVWPNAGDIELASVIN